MCMQCVGIVGTAFQAVTLVGGPVVVKHYQRIRAAFGLPDNSVAAVEARAMEPRGHDEAPAPAAPPVHGERRPAPRAAAPAARVATTWS